MLCISFVLRTLKEIVSDRAWGIIVVFLRAEPAVVSFNLLTHCTTFFRFRPTLICFLAIQKNSPLDRDTLPGGCNTVWHTLIPSKTKAAEDCLITIQSV